MRKLILLLTAIIATSFFVSCGDSTTPMPPITPASPNAPISPPSPPQPMVAPVDIPPIGSAAKLYASNCAKCHGQERQGTPNLSPALTPTSLANQSMSSIENTISEGKNGTAMPGFGGRLSQSEIKAIADFVKNNIP